MNEDIIKDMGWEELISSDTLSDMFAIEEEDPYLFARLCVVANERAEALGRKSDFNKLFRAFKKKLTQALKEGGDRYVYKDVEYDLAGWKIGPQGVYQWGERGAVIACPHPILPIKRLKNIDTEMEKVVIAYLRDGHWSEITFDREKIATAGKIAALSNYGIGVTSENARALVRFLSDVENRNLIALANSTSRFGWLKGEFIPFDKSVEFDSESRFKELSDSLISKGAREFWLNRALEVRQNKEHYEPQLMMAASLSSVLLQPLNLLPFIANLWGGSGNGKSVCIMWATSIWGDPGERGYRADINATQAGFEAREDLLNNLPLAIDDFSKLEERFGDEFSDLVYMLCSGRGKERSNLDLGLNKTKTWQNCTFGSRERPLIEGNMKGGAANRVLDFHTEDGSIFADGNSMAELLRSNYGFAGREFVETVKRLGEEPIKIIHKDFRQRIIEICRSAEREPEEKQVMSLAAILTADKLSTDYIFKDGIYLDLEKCALQLRTIEDVQETYRAYEYIMNMVAINRIKFEPPDHYSGEVWGFIRDDYVHINAVVFSDLAKKGNFSVKAFCSWAQGEGILKANCRGYQNNVRDDEGHQGKRYSLYMKYKGDEQEEADTEERDEGFMPVDYQTELPFG